MVRHKETSERLAAAAARLRDAVSALLFQPPVAMVYNPLEYAWTVHELYLRKYGGGRKRVVFVGMNPGPWGMAQTGVPFGEIAAVRDWMGLSGRVDRPRREHPRRPIEGFSCPRSEVSGRRLWGAFRERFGPAENFFQQHFVANYCPLIFLEETGRNRTPDKLPGTEKKRLFRICDEHLRATVEFLSPDWVIGVGRFARIRAERALSGDSPRVGEILHPSPANPAANRGWTAQAVRRLNQLGVWE